MLSTIQKVTAPKQVTYLGTPAVVREYRFSTNRMGERICRTDWIEGGPVKHMDGTTTVMEPGQVTLRHVKGDGRTPNFRIFNEAVVNGDDEAADTIAQWLKDREEHQA
jgi:hypothetical protein